MSEREGPTWPAEGKAVAAEISERIRSILADAEAAADAMRHQADQDAHARRRAAETESLRIIEDARREAERFLAERIQRVSEMSDEILERGQTVIERLDTADQVRSELAGLVNSLGETAARLANEVRAMPGPKPPEIAAPGAPLGEPSAGAALPEPVAAEPEPEPAPAPSEPAPEPEAAELEAAEPEVTEAEAATPEPELAADPELAPALEPEPDPDPDPDEEPLREPTPLRPETIEPNPYEPAPAAEVEEDDTAIAEVEVAEPEADEPPPEPTPEEIELLERVRAAERERTEGEAEPGVNGDGNGPELVEVDAAPETEPEPEPAVAPRGEGVGAGPDQALGARLVALQMAVAGGNRGEVEAHLRRAFDLSEPDPILDDIFGSGTTADKRVVWPEAG